MPEQYAPTKLENHVVEPNNAHVGHAAISLDSLSDKARDLGRVSGPKAKNSIDYFSPDEWPRLADDEGLADIQNNLIKYFDKLSSRISDDPLPVEIDFPRKLSDKIHAIAAIVGVETAIQKKAIEQLTKFQDVHTVEQLFSGSYVRHILAELQVTPEQSDAITRYFTTSELAKLCVVNAAAPLEAVSAVIENYIRLSGNRKRIVNEWSDNLGISVPAESLTDRRLLELSSHNPRTVDEAIANVGRSISELARRFPQIDNRILTLASFEHAQSEKKAEMLLDKAVQLNEDMTKPDDMAWSSWWYIMYRARGDEGKAKKVILKTVVSARHGREAKLKPDSSDTLPRYADHLNEIMGKSTDAEAEELVYMMQWGDDLMPSILDGVEKMGTAEKEQLELLSEIRKSSQSIGNELARITGDALIADGLKGAHQRATELLYAVYSGNMPQDALRANTILADTLIRIEDALINKEALQAVREPSMHDNQQAYATLDSELTISITEKSRILFAYRIPDKIFDSYGLTDGAVKSRDRVVYIRIDFDNGEFVLDIGSIAQHLRQPRFASTYLGETIAQANNVVKNMREDTGLGFAQRLHPSLDASGHHSTAHFSDARYASSQHMKNITSLLCAEFDQRCGVRPNMTGRRAKLAQISS